MPLSSRRIAPKGSASISASSSASTCLARSRVSNCTIASLHVCVFDHDRAADMRHDLACIEERHDDSLERHCVAAAEIEMDAVVRRHLMFDATAIGGLQRTDTLERIVRHEASLEGLAEPGSEPVAEERETEGMRLDRGHK